MKIKDYSAIYFLRTKKIISEFKPSNNHLAQFVFRSKQKKAYLGGMKFVLELLDKYKNIIKITNLIDGTLIYHKDVVLEISGDYSKIIHLEGIICGLFARGTRICTNVKKILKLINTKKIIYAADRSDHYLNQEFDGYCAYVAGIRTFVTNAHIKYIENKKHVKVVGTIPHSLIQMFNGDLFKACNAFSTMFPKQKLFALVDFNNNVIKDSIKIVNQLGNKIYGVRIDTSPDILDLSFKNNKSMENFGVSAALISNLRKDLDKNNMKNIKIMVSSGIDENKIKKFIKHNLLIDFYLIGGFFLKNTYNFCCDLVKNNNIFCSKYGRKYKKIKK